VTGFELRGYRPGDEASINEGFNEVFGHQRPLEEWRWKFRPDEDGCRVLVATATAQVVAHFAAQRLAVQIDGRQFIAGHTCDAYCRPMPSARRARLYLKTAEEFYRRYGAPGELDFLYGFPGDRHMRLGRLRLRFAEPVAVPVWRRPVAQRRAPWWPRYRVKSGGHEALDDLWLRAKDRYPVSVVRDRAWARRRYDDHPSRRYLQFTVLKGGVAHAWAVAHIGDNVARWVDLVWDGRDTRALASLDTALGAAAQSAGTPALELWMAGDLAVEAFLAGGGWNRDVHPAHLQMTAISFNPALDAENLVRRFYFTMGDTDLI
jgi:hypothetical protein